MELVLVIATNCEVLNRMWGKEFDDYEEYGTDDIIQYDKWQG